MTSNMKKGFSRVTAFACVTMLSSGLVLGGCAAKGEAEGEETPKDNSILVETATPKTENISQYVVSIESYTYGDETVGVLTDALEELNTLGNPDFHRFKADINGKEYSLAFIKKENFIEYLIIEKKIQ